MQENYNSNDGFKDEALPFIMYNPENKRKLFFSLTPKSTS